MSHFRFNRGQHSSNYWLFWRSEGAVDSGGDTCSQIIASDNSFNHNCSKINDFNTRTVDNVMCQDSATMKKRIKAWIRKEKPSKTFPEKRASNIEHLSEDFLVGMFSHHQCGLTGKGQSPYAVTGRWLKFLPLKKKHLSHVPWKYKGLKPLSPSLPSSCQKPNQSFILSEKWAFSSASATHKLLSKESIAYWLQILLHLYLCNVSGAWSVEILGHCCSWEICFVCVCRAANIRELLRNKKLYNL